MAAVEGPVTASSPLIKATETANARQAAAFKPLSPKSTSSSRLSLARESDTGQLLFAPDGQTALTLTGGKVWLWERASGALRGTFGTRDLSPVGDVFLAPDGQTLFIAHLNGTVALWDRTSQRRLRQVGVPSQARLPTRYPPEQGLLSQPSPRQARPLFSRDGRTLFTRVGEGYATWDTRTGARQRVFAIASALRALRARLPRGTALSGPSTNWKLGADTFALSPNGRILATALEIQDAKSPPPAEVDVPSPVVAPFLASEDSPSRPTPEGVLCLWNASDGRLLRVIYGAGLPTTLAFSPDGQSLAASTIKRAIHPQGARSGQIETDALSVWSLPDGVLRHTFDSDYGGEGALTFSPDGRYLLAGDSSQHIGVWEMPAGRMVHRWRNEGASTTLRDDWVTELVFTPRGDFLWSLDYGGPTLRRFPDGQRVLLPPRMERGPLMPLAFSPNGRLLLTSYDDQSAALWDVPRASLLRVLRFAPDGFLKTVAFSPDSKLLATAVFHYVPSLEPVSIPNETQTGAARHPLHLPTPTPEPMVRAEHGESFTQVATWNVEIGQPTGWSLRTTETVNGLAFAPDSVRLAVSSGSGDFSFSFFPESDIPLLRGRTQMWDIARRTLLWVDEQNGVARGELAFSPDGRLLVSPYWAPVVRHPGGKANMWELRPYDGLETRAPALTRPSRQGAVRVWDAATGRVERDIAPQDELSNAVQFLNPTQTRVWREPAVPTLITRSDSLETREWRAWDAVSGAFLFTIPNADGHTVLSPDGTMLLNVPEVRSKTQSHVYKSPPQLRRRTLDENGFQTMLPAFPDAFSGIFSPDGRLIAAGSRDGISLWNTRTEQRLLTLAALPLAYTPQLLRLLSPPSSLLRLMAPESVPWAALTPQGDYSGSANIEPFLAHRQEDTVLPLGDFAHRRPDRVQLALTAL